MNYRRFFKYLLIYGAGVSLCLIIYLTYQFFSLQATNSIADVEKSDCIVVLGAAVWENARPSPVFGDRLQRAADLYHAGIARKIIVSGGLGIHPPEEAEVGRIFLVNAGVAETDIIREMQGMTTFEQGERIREICARENFKSIALVTSFFHERRAIQIFNNAGLDNVRDARCPHVRFQDINKWLAREAVALAVMNWWLWFFSGLLLGGLWIFLSKQAKTKKYIRRI